MADTKTDDLLAFRANMTPETWYRRAYAAFAADDPAAVAGLTNPDDAGPGFDFGAALDQLRRATQTRKS